MKRNQTGFVPVIIILVVLIGFVGIYFLGTLKNKPTVVNPTSSPLTVATQSPIPAVKPTGKTVVTADSTANWKTYTNNEYDFSIKYPSTWMNETSQDEVTNGNKEFRFKTEKNEYVSGVIFNGVTYRNKLENWEKEIDIKNGKSILFTYTDNLGPGSKGGTVDIDTFNIFVSTLSK